jgi:hypothetical protein
MYDHNEAKKRESEWGKVWEEGLNRLSKERINRSETKKEKERRIETQIDEFAQEERERRRALEGIARREAVNHPPHYNQGKIEVIDAIEDWGLDFNAGNVVKYVARHQHKAEPLEDLKKARWYLDRIIKGMENGSIKD